MALSTRPLYKLSEAVRFSLTGEHGRVFGVATYVDEVPSYLVRYVSSQGSVESRWVNASMIEPVESGGV